MIDQPFKTTECKTSHTIRTPVVLLLLVTLIVGGLYPLVVTLVSQLLFPTNANGSLVIVDNKVVGSRLLGQQFTHPNYFWGRLSATSPAYNAASSSGSNLSPANPKLLEVVNECIAQLKKIDPTNKAPIPVDLVTASASGLDPHISPDAAYYQMKRIAKARKLKEDEVRLLIQQHTEHRMLGFLGEPRVNVLELNLALDALK
ncbi:MAG: potassium-transporting ATPase subunit KdpC [Rickettsiales bacterium]|nr:potassium-transporting ATPase subunit KdpC [Rickettsiales bacterium]